MDSKSEYVRCLCFAQEDILYVATNHGYLYHVKVSAGNVKWYELVRSDEKVPAICMDLLSTNSSNSHEDVDDWIATGDGKGNTTVVGIINSDCNPKVVTSFTWTAEKERQLLGTYWCKSLGCRYTPDVDSRSVSRLLGEHVGGSSVRSICFISKIHTATIGQTYIRLGCDAVPVNRDDPFLLISVGAKWVLTSWLLWNKSHKEEADVGGVLTKAENLYSHLSEECTAVSFQWLSTHMPPKFASTHKGVENMEQNNEHRRNIALHSACVS